MSSSGRFSAKKNDDDKVNKVWLYASPDQGHAFSWISINKDINVDELQSNECLRCLSTRKG